MVVLFLKHCRIVARHEFMPEMLDGRQHRIRRPPAKRAQAGRLHRLTEIGQDFQITQPTLATLDPFKNLPRSHRADATRRTFPARFTGGATVLPDKVVIEDFAGRHGNGTVRVAGTGLTGPGTWDLKLAGHDLDV